MLRRERMKREAEGALTQSGLTLDEQRRALYHTRYVEERRKLELGLRQELQQRRQQELPPMIDRLRREFEPQQMRPSASGTSTPNVSPIKHR